MRLMNLIASNENVTLQGEDREIIGITADSRKVEPGFLFAAVPGTKQDGRAFIKEAIARGATALLVPQDTNFPVEGHASVLKTADIRIAVSALAAAFYPRQPKTIAAVTGTSGKTSTAQFTREIWQALGHKSASIGTLGFVTEDKTLYGSLTTPDAILLHQLLNEGATNGITHLAMEASSHGIFMNRLDHVRLKAGGFTNLSRDHLDFHETMGNYLAAKLRLFSTLLPEGAVAVLNADAPEFDAFAKAGSGRQLKIISYGLKGKEIKLMDAIPHAQGQVLRFELFGKKQDVLLPAMGKFQAWNALCALGLAIGSGEDPDLTAKALAKVSGVPGRLQLIGHTKGGAVVFVDYAHKPDALENVLAALRPHVAKGARLGVIFGCGGNRDKGKRPMMGAIAKRLADWVIVTDDNPRHEEPAAIRKEILAACAGASEIGDRAKAIAAGIERLKAGDVLVIAGKGHESGQIVGDQILPFDDADQARQVLEK